MVILPVEVTVTAPPPLTAPIAAALLPAVVMLPVEVTAIAPPVLVAGNRPRVGARGGDVAGRGHRDGASAPALGINSGRGDARGVMLPVEVTVTVAALGQKSRRLSPVVVMPKAPVSLLMVTGAGGIESDAGGPARGRDGGVRLLTLRVVTAGGGGDGVPVH